MSDGSYVKAQDLRNGDSIASAFFSDSHGYTKVTYEKKQQKTAQLIWETFNFPVPLGYVIHHKNEQKNDDSLKNLGCISDSEHKRHHAPKECVWKKHGLKPPRLIMDTTEIIKLYQSGLSIAETGRLTGHGYRATWGILEREGIKRRTLAEAQKLRRQKERNGRIIDVELLEERADVYCLSVPETGNFMLANGAIVHNSLQPELAGAEDKARKKKKGGFSRRTQKSLAFLASVFTRESWWKDYDFHNTTDRYILCGKDCCVTLECAEKMEEMLK